MRRTTLIAYGGAALLAAVMGCGGAVVDAADSGPGGALHDAQSEAAADASLQDCFGGCLCFAADACPANFLPNSENDAEGSEASTALPACQWPASLNDGGRGACSVGRAYVECSYPEGFSCAGGPGGSGGGSSGGGVTQLCISDDPTSCPGCESINGPATCTNKCAPNEYVVSCGGLPPFPAAGGPPDVVYQQAPAGCVPVIPEGTAGNVYSCCPCE
jgi:hypothetical protein